VVGTYVSVLLAGGASLLIGQAVLTACGWQKWSWLAPAVGLAALTTLAWATARLGYDGVGPLVAALVASAASLAFLWRRVEGVGTAIRIGLPIALAAVLVASIPFAVEGRFGILGTGFNVDMSQHLFAADWLSGQNRPEPGLVDQGYPLGPHSLAVAGAELSGVTNVVTPFSGVTIVVPVLAALTALTVLSELPALRRGIAALLVAFPYLVASYLAQGAFKELYMGLFLLGFALVLHELTRGEPRKRGPTGVAAAVPLAILALGAIYAYSGPGLAWLVGALGLWGALELWRRQRAGGDPGLLLRRAAAPGLVALAVFFIGAAPEAGRIADFGGNVSAVADPTDLEPAPDVGPGSSARRESEGTTAAPTESTGNEAGGGSGRLSRSERRELYTFNSDLGNLFGQVNPVEALGVWPSGDFRVQPGGGGVPGVVFYLGALLGAVALAFGLRGWLRRGELAVPAALGAAVIIYLGARGFSTPYTTAKALQMVAPLAALIAFRELLAPGFLSAQSPGFRNTFTAARMRPARAALVSLFVAAAAISSLLALANAPIGPRSYSPGLTRLSSNTDGAPTLILAPPRQVSERHGRSFLGWELRGARPICVTPDDGKRGGEAPPGISFVIVSDSSLDPPFEDLELVVQRGQYVLWERTVDDGVEPPRNDPNEPTACTFADSA
jgi:hypothetical protein